MPPSEAPLTDEQRQMCDELFKLAMALAHREYSATLARLPWLEADEVHARLEEMAFDGLIAAARGWQPERGVPFVGYAGQMIRGYLRHMARDETRAFRRGHADRLEDYEVLSDPTNEAAEACTRMFRERLFAALPPEQREVMDALFAGTGYQDAADALGIPISTFMGRAQRARKALKVAWAVQTAEATVACKVPSSPARVRQLLAQIERRIPARFTVTVSGAKLSFSDGDAQCEVDADDYPVGQEIAAVLKVRELLGLDEKDKKDVFRPFYI